MDTKLYPTTAKSHQSLHDPRLRAPKFAFINHTPRDFEIDAAISAHSAHPLNPSTSFHTMLTPLQASFGLGEVEDSPSPQARSYSWAWDEKKETATVTPLVNGQKILQPRDAKILPDHTATDVAYFLRDTRPPQYEFTELEPSIKSPSTEKLRRVLKFGISRTSDLAKDSRTHHPKLKNVVEKTSLDGTKYLQIIPHHPYFLDPLVHDFAVEKSNSNLEGLVSMNETPDTSRQDLPKSMSRFRSNPDLVDKNKEHSETTRPTSAEPCVPEVENPAAIQKELHNGLVFTSNPLCVTSDGTKSVLPRARPVVPYDEYLHRGPGGSGTLPPDYVNEVQDNGHELSFQSHIPHISAPTKPLTPVPESRVVSLGLSDLSGSAVQLLCQNGHPFPSGHANNESFSNQGRRVSRERTSSCSQPFPVSPSRIPPRQESLRALTGSLTAISDANTHESPPSPSLVDDACHVTERVNGPDHDATPYPSGSESLGKRADRTRARKLRDLRQTREKNELATKKSHEKLSQVLQTDWPAGENATPPNVDNDQIPIVAGNNVQENEHSSKRAASAQRSMSVPKEASRKISTTELRRPNTISAHATFSFPLPPHQIPSSLPNLGFATYPNTSEMDTHPAFRQRSLTPSDPFPRLSTDKHPSSLPTLSRVGTPLEHGSFYSNSSFRGTAPSPILGKEAQIQARLESLERKNKLLEAALFAVLKTAGYINGCPCGGQGIRPINEGGPDSKRESEASASTILSADGSEPSALELYMSTRGNFSRDPSMRLAQSGDYTGCAKPVTVRRHDVTYDSHEDTAVN